MPPSKRLEALTHSTAETEVGPTMSWRPGAAVLRYDAETAERVVWTSVTFAGALALRLTPDVAVDAWMLDAYSAICELEDSTWRERLASTAAEGASGLRAARHFFVYFDHVGCFEILAASFDVISRHDAT